jgi:hypothetical protein
MAISYISFGLFNDALNSSHYTASNSATGLERMWKEELKAEAVPGLS